MKKIITKIKRSGFVEILWLFFLIFFLRFFSIIRIFFLKLRGYNVDYSVLLEKGVVLFQSNKNSVVIQRNSFIGSGVRIKAGFDGKIIIGKNVKIHDFSFIFSHYNLTIGDNTLISPQVFITDFNHRLPHSKYGHLLDSKNGYVGKTVTIGKNVWIGAHAVILPGVSIGDDAVIGAGSVVTKSVKNKEIVVGNPARVIKKSF